MEIQIKISQPNWKKVTAVIVLALVFACGFWFWQNRDTSNIPGSIKSQLPFKAVYAPAGTVAQDSYTFEAERKALIFSLKFDDTDIIITQQPAPDNLAIGSQVYFQALGLRPTAQFATKVGAVAVANFYKTGTLEPAGQTAVLLADDNKTLVLAKPKEPNQKLSNDQWKKLFESLKLSK